MVNIPAKVPAKATPSGETDPFGFVERRVWTDRMLEALRKGGPEGGKWYSLHDKVFAKETLRAAFERVAANHGAPGVDGITVAVFGESLEEEIERLQSDWKAGKFRAQPIRRKWIPKPGSDEMRPLGIPTVRDRVVQAALRLVMEPIFEMDFHDNSHGFRPGRRASDAMNVVMTGLKAGKVWVVDADLKGYFDSIPHGPLLQAVKRRITDGRILDLLEMFLKAGVMEYGIITEPEAGSPQGGVISPLLANIYLNDLDHLMAKKGWQMTRYADDFVILCSNQTDAEQALTDVKTWTVQTGLVLHPVKTRIVDLGQPGNHIDFLGYRLKQHRNQKTGIDKILRLVRPKSLNKIEGTIRQHTKRTNGTSLPTIIGNLNQVFRGWFAYFRTAHFTIHERLDQTTRRRLRAILAKRRKRPSWGGGHCHNKWPNAYFAKRGLFSLKEAHEKYLQPC
jgi:RNA-directed DNA polymerase